MLLVIDNYDSFTYNLVQAFGELGAQVKVYRHNRLDIAGIERMKPDHIVISPGPCTPDKAGISLNVISHFAGKVPLLGICLGHQCLGQAFGGKVVRAKLPVHGKTSLVNHNEAGVFAGLPNPLVTTRYHSLIIERRSIPSCLEITAETSQGEIMGIRHKALPCLEGVQFHPESILTEHGNSLLANFLRYRIIQGEIKLAPDRTTCQRN